MSNTLNAKDAVQVTVTAGVAGASALTMQEWVHIFTILVLMFQAIVMLPKLFNTLRGFVRWLKK